MENSVTSEGSSKCHVILGKQLGVSGLEQVTQKHVNHQIIQYTEVYQREGAGIV